MKKFETPEIEVLKMEVADIITASFDDEWNGENGGNNTGWN